MDRKHKLDAPNNETLKTIEQLDDRSELSVLYPSRGKQWDGDLVTPEEREKRRQAKHDTISFGMRKQFWLVGLLAPLPLVILSFFIGIIFAIATEQNIPVLVLPGMIGLLVWFGVTFFILKKVIDVFYRHSLRAMPYIVTLVLYLGFSMQTIYLATAPIHQQKLIPSIATVSLAELLWSIVLSYGLIMLFTTPRLSGNAKMGIILGFGLILFGLLVGLTIANL